MANIKSAKKRILVNRTKAERNKAIKSGVKTAMKKVLAAVEAGDVIIMEDKPSKIVEGIKGARRTLRIVNQNLFGSLGIKGGILILSAFGITNMWIAVFGDVGVTILAVLNSLRLLRKKN